MPTTRMNHYLAALLVLGTPHAAAGQAEQAIARCAKLTSEPARIECLENALRGEDSAPAGDVDEAVSGSDARAAEPKPSMQAEAEAAPAAVSRDAGRSPEVADDSAATRFGLPPERSDAAGADEIAVTVTAVSQDAYGKLIFTTDGGQVWIQTDQNRRRYRDVPFEAEIRSGASGSFFLRQATGGPSVRVRRRK